MDLRGLLPLALCTAGCAGQTDDVPRNLIVISIDTLRADRLGCYGYERDTSPALDAFAERAVRFQHAVAESSWTLPSHFSLLSGLYPSTHGVVDPTLRPSDETPLLAEKLRDEGFYTFALTGGGWLTPDYGFGRGFLAFEGRRRGLQTILDEARATIAAAHGERPFFAFLHTYDVHCPYDPGEPWASRFNSEDASPIETEGRCGNPDFNAMDLSPAEVRFLSDRYDASVRRADDELGAFLRFLEDEGVLADTVVVVTSDHGEEFDEHGSIGHEGTLHREVLEIPLLIYAPGQPPGVETRPAGLVDVVPTVLALLGLEASAELEGEPLLGPSAPSEAAPYRYSELAWNGDLESWLGPDRHWIVDRATGTATLFNLERDPGEHAGTPTEPPDFALRRVRRRAVRSGPAPEGATAAELRALGYAGSEEFGGR